MNSALYINSPNCNSSWTNVTLSGHSNYPKFYYSARNAEFENLEIVRLKIIHLTGRLFVQPIVVEFFVENSTHIVCRNNHTVKSTIFKPDFRVRSKTLLETPNFI